ncbi:TonB-dependent receptor [Sphingomonas sp. AOB5]|uniref:TonB-dependent receptor n=1 Tax=Sphingomonas sp. AOB5 TaxID=3034017 RepID=UPI0023F6EBAD|nr:TonB-dependent receptor [Sphingomonas sp. AOB5]MDF7774762.1 TonB-dependent receptor [Sphingomonas sp. AOB5]
MNHIRKIATLAAASTLAIALATPAFAQNAPAAPQETEEASGLTEIVVTANRRAQNLQDVPIAITAVTAETLESSGTVNTLQLERISPGLQVYQTGSAALPFLRGVGSNQSNPGFESPVAIYIDGIYQAGKIGNVFDLPNVERLEVLKGPQGTLFGRNATGGAISIITRDPGPAPEFSAEIGYGRFNDIRGKVYAAGPITDTLGISVSATARKSDGYIYNAFLRQDANPSSNVMGMAKLVWTPTPEFTAKFSGSYFENNDPTFLAAHVVEGTIPPGTSPTGAGGLFVTNYDKFTMRSNHETYVNTHGYRLSADLQYDLGPVKLVSLTGYIDVYSENVSNSPASESAASYSGSGTPSKMFSQELQLQSTGSGALTWIVGGYFSSTNEGFSDLISVANVPSPFRPADLLVAGASVTAFHVELKTQAFAGFAEANYQLTDKLRFTAGLRYTSEERSIEGYRYNPTAVSSTGNTNIPIYNGVLGAEPLVFGRNVAAASITDRSKTFQRVTWRAALDYKVTDDVMLYASYNRGFKSGSYTATSLGATVNPVNPEVLDAYEIGFKSEFADRTIRFNAAAFYYDYSNIQVGLITGAGVTTVENAAAARIMGIDAELTWQPSPVFQVRTAINVLDSEYKNYGRAQIFLPKTSAAACTAPPPAITQAQAEAIVAAPKFAGACSYALDASGLPLIFSPDFTANIGADYTIPAGDSRLVLSGSLYYNSGFDITPGGYFSHVNGYSTLSASATWHGPNDRYFLRIWGDNLTDSKHAIYISPQAAAFQEVTARPISYGVTLGFKFGN